MNLKGVVFGGANVPGVALNIGLAVLRVTAGAGICYLHGWGKLPVSQGFIDSVGGLGFPAPAVFAWAAALTEVVGGGLVALGLATRPAALALAFNMGVAAFLAHGADPLAQKELALLYFAAFLLFALRGAGRVSIDAMVATGGGGGGSGSVKPKPRSGE